MTTIKYTIDRRVAMPRIDGGTYLFGIVETRDTVGGDRTAAEKAAGVYPPHPYKGTRTSTLHGDYWLTWTEYGVTHTGREAMPGGSGITVNQSRIWDSNDEILLLGKLAEKYRQHDWNAGVFVGELGKTVSTVASRMRQFGRAALAVKRGRLLEAYKLLRVPPDYGYIREYTTWTRSRKAKWYDVWLELRYAWTPLLYDIYNLSEAIRQYDVPRQAVFRVSHHIGKTVTAVLPEIFACKGSGRYAKQIIATVKEKPFTFPEYLGLTNPGAIAWELLPLSFVVDWFIPIGNYVQTRSVLAGMEGSYVRTTYDWHRGRITGMAPGYKPDTTPPLTSEIRDPSSWTTSVEIDRTIVNTLSVPLPTFRNPLGNSSPGKRIMDASSLIAAAFFRPVWVKAV